MNKEQMEDENDVFQKPTLTVIRIEDQIQTQKDGAQTSLEIFSQFNYTTDS